MSITVWRNGAWFFVYPLFTFLVVYCSGVLSTCLCVNPMQDEWGSFRSWAAASSSHPSDKSPDILKNIWGIEGKKWRDFHLVCFISHIKVEEVFQPTGGRKRESELPAILGPAGVLGYLLTLVSYCTTTRQGRILWHTEMQQLEIILAISSLAKLHCSGSIRIMNAWIQGQLICF